MRKMFRVSKDGDVKEFQIIRETEHSIWFVDKIGEVRRKKNSDYETWVNTPQEVMEPIVKQTRDELIRLKQTMGNLKKVVDNPDESV